MDYGVEKGFLNAQPFRPPVTPSNLFSTPFSGLLFGSALCSLARFESAKRLRSPSISERIMIYSDVGGKSSKTKGFPIVCAHKV